MNKDDNQLDDFFSPPGEMPGTDSSAHKNLKETLSRKLSFRTKMHLIPKLLSPRERYSVFLLLLVIIGSIIAMPFAAYYHYTVEKPQYGGSFTEGILGAPRMINPLLAQANDADRDLSALIFSGLLKYNADGALVPDLAKSYEISDDGLNYTVYLRDNAFWHDGEPVTADDVVFTIQTAQNPDYGSLQRVNWQGVEIDKVNDKTIIFKLKNKYAQFLNNLTIGILPKHLWQDVKPINFTLNDLNVRPIGSGPYIFSKLKKDKLGAIESYTLESNHAYYDGRPYIDTIVIKFFNTEDDLIAAYNKNEVEDIGALSASNLGKLKFRKRLNIRELKLPRYFGAFFNQNQSKPLSDKNVRLALNYATNKQEIIEKILNGKGVPVDSPMINGILNIGGDTPLKTYSFDQDLANKILDEDGWSTRNSDGIRTKNDVPLEVRLTTSTWPELSEVATLLKEEWKAVGVNVAIETFPISQLQQIIKDRQYQILLFGEILTIDPDPFSLWHSSQKRDPGLNLALYDNKTADTLLEDARQTLNPIERAKKYDDFQRLVIEDIPGVFLYSPLYLYPQAKKIKGFNTTIVSVPSDRFDNVAKWYIKTTRVKKN